MDNYNKALNSQKIAQEVDRNIQKQTEEKKENKPDNGKKAENQSVWGLISLVIAGMLGLVGYNNKQKKHN